MKTGRISTVFAAAVMLASIGILGAATPASADALCDLTDQQCMNSCPEPIDCPKQGPACTKMVRTCQKACFAQFKACLRKHPG